MAKLIPAILETDVAAVVEKAQWLQKRQEFFYRAQIDVVDGTFAPGKTFDDPGALPELGIELEVHLMVMHPELVLRGWLRHPNIKRIIVHLEAAEQVAAMVTRTHAAGKEFALALNPHSVARTLDPYLDQVDGVLMLSVTPGKQGQPMQTDVLEEIKELQRTHPSISICIDGGVNMETVGRALKAGATEIVVGSGIWKAPEPEAALKQFFSTLANF